MKINEIYLKINLTNRNQGQGKHWYQTHKDRLAIEQYLQQHVKKPTAPYMQQVAIHCVRLYGGRCRAWDSDSVLRGNFKQILDAMVSHGFFLDDRMKYIMQCVGSQEKVHPSETGVRIEIHDQPARFL